MIEMTEFARHLGITKKDLENALDAMGKAGIDAAIKSKRYAAKCAHYQEVKAAFREVGIDLTDEEVGKIDEKVNQARLAGINASWYDIVEIIRHFQ